MHHCQACQLEVMEVIEVMKVIEVMDVRINNNHFELSTWIQIQPFVPRKRKEGHAFLHTDAYTIAIYNKYINAHITWFSFTNN